MNFPYLRTTADRRDCLHCEFFTLLSWDSETKEVRGSCPNTKESLTYDLTCDLWSDRYTPRVEIKVNKE